MTGEKPTSQLLAARVVLYRALGYEKEKAIEAMKELTLRKQAGDEFDFEQYISEKLQEFPKSTFNSNVSDAVRKAFKVK
jgi:hypothetical protein